MTRATTNIDPGFVGVFIPVGRRRGLTLMEVLVSIFIMAIGMLALLTLFPLGAIRMEQAIKDDRCAQAAVQATELAKILDLANDAYVRYALNDPNVKDANGNPLPGAAGPTQVPSTAVLVDAFGTTPYLDASNNIARVASYYGINTSTQLEFFTLTDDLSFQAGTGFPRTFGSTIGREIRFSWTYLLQRPTVQNPGITNYTVCVYHRRPVAGALEFTLPNASLNITDSTISFTATDPSAVKQILPGQWVLDATIAKSIGPGPAATASASTVAPAGTLVPMANFYRIVNVRQGSTANETILDLQTPIRGYDKILNPSDVDTATGKLKYPKTGTASVASLVIQDALVEAIDIGPLR